MSDKPLEIGKDRVARLQWHWPIDKILAALREVVQNADRMVADLGWSYPIDELALLSVGRESKELDRLLDRVGSGLTYFNHCRDNVESLFVPYQYGVRY